ncbi:hypothetical protein Tco_1183339 [Tanacetum coccineum]
MVWFFSCGCKAEIWVTKGLLVKAKGNILGWEIIRVSGNTLRVSQSRINNEKLVHTLLKGHSTLSLEDSLSRDCDVKKNGLEEGSYLAKGTLGRVLEAKTVEVLKAGTEHNATDALMKVVPGHKLQHCLELLSVGGLSSQTYELCDVYLTEKELHQLHLDEEDLKETLEEQAMDEKEREEKIRQKQTDDEEFMLEFGRKFDSDYDTRVEQFPLTPNPFRIIPRPAGIVQLSSSTCVEPSSSTSNSVKIIPGPADIVQQAKMLKEKIFILDSDGALIATNYVTATSYWWQLVLGVGDIKNFLKKGKLDEVVAIVKSCSPNDIGDLNVTMKDLSIVQ